MLSSSSRALAKVAPIALGAVLVVFPFACASSDAPSAPVPVVIADAGFDSAPPGAWVGYDMHIQSTLRSVWGSSASDVYAVGYDPGAIVHSDDRGVTWSVKTLDPTIWLMAVGGSGPDDVYAVGHRERHAPIVMHTADRGVTWQTMDLPFLGATGAIWSSGPDDTYIVGDASVGPGAVILHTKDRGATWGLSPIAGADGVQGIWGSGPNDIYVAGARRIADVVATDAGDPSGTSTDASADDASLIDAGTRDARATAAGSDPYEGVVLHSTDGARTWTVATTTPTGVLFAIGGSPDGMRIIAVGRGNTMTQSLDHGATWEQYAGAFEVGPQLTSVWLHSADEYPFIAGDELGLVRDIEGIDPEPTVSQSENTPLRYVLGVWGFGDDVYAVGDEGVVVHEIGSPW